MACRAQQGSTICRKKARTGDKVEAEPLASIAKTTPVIIGAGQSLDRIDSCDYRALSAPDLATQAARIAIGNARASTEIATLIQAIATTRTFEDSLPDPAPFGRSDNFPRSVAKRLGIEPELAVWEKAGGNSPQDLVGEFCNRVANGELDLVLITGAEAISTVRHALKQGRSLDFAEHAAGSVDDRGAGLEAFRDPLARRHGLVSPTLCYALAETARRARLGLDRKAYAAQMEDLFAPFAAVAAANPYSAWDVPTYGRGDLLAINRHNRWIADPYPLRLIARDQVNQGAAILIASTAMADAMGCAPERRIYLHGWANATEKPLLARPDLGASPASIATCQEALRRARATPADVGAFDFYSCYPIAVTNAAIDGLGLAPNDPRGLTLTGGLPFFGGPGNNYSMHAIAEAVEVARCSAKKVLVGANGGYLSKYSAGLYSAEPRNWQAKDGAFTLPAVDDIRVFPTFDGTAAIESFTVHHDRDGPAYATATCRTAEGSRFITRSTLGDRTVASVLHEQDGLGRAIYVKHVDGYNQFTLHE